MGASQTRKSLATSSNTTQPPPAANSGQKARIGFVQSAAADFRRLPEKARNGLMAKLKELAFHPDCGKPLTGALQGCSRVTYGRLRCVVRVAEGVAVVLVLVVAERKAGSRDDAYEVATEVVAKNEPGTQDLLARHVRAFLNQMPPDQRPRLKTRAQPAEIRAQKNKKP